MLANIIRNRKKTAIGGGGGGIVTGGDPYYSAVSMLLPMDGTNGSTTFTDSGPNALTVTPTSATISTTQSKYGGASGYFDGSSSSALTIPASSVFNFGTGDFTIEFWFNIPVGASGSPYGKTFVSNENNVWSAGAFSLYALASSTQFRPSFWINEFSGSVPILIPSSGDYRDGNWHHFAIVRNGSSFSMYIDGSLAANGTHAGNCGSSTRNLMIGDNLANNGGDRNFLGKIDDLRISQFARYVSTFTPPTAALPTTASSTPADPYYGYTSLLLHMDGSNASTDFVDSGPNALTVTRTGTPAISTSQSKYGGSSVAFSGTTDRLDVASNALFAFGAGDFTVEFWLYFNSVSTAQTSFVNVNVTGGFSCYWTASAYYSVPVNNFVVSNRSVGQFQSTWIPSANTWYHVAISRSGTNLKVFINGAQLGSTVTSSTSYIQGPLQIGGSTDGVGWTVNGNIDDLRITKYARYTSAFTPPTQAHLEYANGNDRHFSNVSLLLHMDGANGSTTFTDNSASARTITAVGNAQISTTQSKFGGASAYFDGTGDYLSFTGGMPSGTGTAFTIECWIRLDDLNSYRSITRTAGGLDIGVQPNGLVSCDQTSVGIIADSATGIITAGTWYHIAVTRDTSNAYKVYVNGTQVASGTNSFSVTAATTIGYSAYSGSHYFKGYIDDFRATNVLRYTANFTPPTQAHPNS